MVWSKALGFDDTPAFQTLGPNGEFRPATGVRIDQNTEVRVCITLVGMGESNTGNNMLIKTLVPRR